DERDVDEEAEDDRRHAGHHVDEVADDRGEARVLAVLDEVERDADPDRDGDRRGERDHRDRAEDRRLDATGIPEERAGGIRAEEVPRDRPRALLDQVVEDQDERHERDRGGHGQAPARDLVAAAAAGADRRERRGGTHSAHAAASALTMPGAASPATTRLRVPRTTNQRAAMLTSSVSTNSTRPAAISAARWRLLLAASPNSLAITAASVYPWLKIVCPMFGALPMTSVTAIVSPIARPRPSIEPPV